LGRRHRSVAVILNYSLGGETVLNNCTARGAISGMDKNPIGSTFKPSAKSLNSIQPICRHRQPHMIVQEEAQLLLW